MANGDQVAQTGKGWLAYWSPFIIPLVLAISRILTKAKLAGYPAPIWSSDLCYFGVTFYVWALTARLNKISVCPPQRWPGRDDAEEGIYIVLFLILNFVLSVLFYPMSKDVSLVWLVLSMVVACVVAIGSPIFLRWRFQR